MWSFFTQQTFLYVVNYYSKFPIVCELHNHTAYELIQVCAEIEGEYGFPKRMVSDVGFNVSVQTLKLFAMPLTLQQ